MSRKQAYVYFYASYHGKNNQIRDLDIFRNQDTRQNKSFCNSASIATKCRHSLTHPIPHMANIHQDGNSIRNIQMVSSNHVHSTHKCEANKCRIFKPFFLFIRLKVSNASYQKNVEEDKF